MATSGTTSFNLDLAEILEEAYERCGAELRSGYDYRTARRSLNLLFMEWANRGINLWTITSGSVAMVNGTASYSLPTDTVDLIEHVMRTGSGVNQTDLTMSRISNSTYASIPNKNSPGRPLQLMIDRQATTPSITVWPVPDSSSTYTLVYWYLRRVQDAGTATNTQDVPYRFIPALVAGLAYYLALKLPNALDRIEVLKAQYDDAWNSAADEDREKATLRLVPGMSRL